MIQNYEICQGVMLLYVEAIKIFGESLEQVTTSNIQNPYISICDHMSTHSKMCGFYTSDVVTLSKLFKFFIIGYLCDNMTPQQVS
jgi:hypothetical protein